MGTTIEVIKHSENGRTALYQWDTGRKIKIQSEKMVDEVHFSNVLSKGALVVTPKIDAENGAITADIPNILLQTFMVIDVWIVCHSENGEYTNNHEKLDVMKRPKPSDYVYTETEVKNWDALERRIKELEDNQASDEVIEEVVESYLEKNPVEIEVDKTLSEESENPVANKAVAKAIKDVEGKIPTDYVSEEALESKGYLTEHQPLDDYAKKSELPSKLPASDVYSWAKQPTKPSYTAKEVGAMPEDAKIPTKTSELENDSGFLTEIQKVEETYPKKVFEFEWKGNYDIIDVTDIDYDSGILTVSSMPEQITDNVNTTVRVFPEIKVEGEKAPYRYGMMPKELMSTAAYYFAVKKGDKQIILCHPTTLEEITTLTSSDVINLTRWNLYVEKKRKATQSAVSVKNLDNTHKYRMLYYMPHSVHFCAGITFYAEDGGRYGSGYGEGYSSLGAKGREGTKDAANVLACLLSNSYETISVRGKYYGYSETILERYPALLEAEVYKVNDQAFIVQSNVTYFANADSLNDTSVFATINAKNSIYLQRPYESVSFGLGNDNYMVDGAKMEVWDLGEIK